MVAVGVVVLPCLQIDSGDNCFARWQRRGSAKDFWTGEITSQTIAWRVE